MLTVLSSCPVWSDEGEVYPTGLDRFAAIRRFADSPEYFTVAAEWQVTEEEMVTVPVGEPVDAIVRKWEECTCWTYVMQSMVVAGDVIDAAGGASVRWSPEIHTARHALESIILDRYEPGTNFPALVHDMRWAAEQPEDTIRWRWTPAVHSGFGQHLTNSEGIPKWFCVEAQPLPPRVTYEQYVPSVMRAMHALADAQETDAAAIKAVLCEVGHVDTFLDAATGTIDAAISGDPTVVLRCEELFDAMRLCFARTTE
jgi:hypothetical protein